MDVVEAWSCRGFGCGQSVLQLRLLESGWVRYEWVSGIGTMSQGLSRTC